MPGQHEPRLPRIGDVLDGRYRVTGMLGEGGMGCVYRAEHVAIRRPLALKLLHPEMEGIEEVTKRFEREAFATGRVDHPNCVNVSDFGQLDDGTLYMVLELLDGVLLFDLLVDEERLQWRRALHIARHILRGLASAHSAGIVHRDVKPENVILVKHGDDPDFAKILDFGIAKLFDDAKKHAGDHTLTRVGVTVGTPTYIAPEQAFGQPVDGRADLYSLSIVLFEMLAGAPPFEADDVIGLLTQHATAEVPAIRDVAPGARVPREVEQLLRAGLAKSRDERIQTAEDYIDRIDRILERGQSTAKEDAATTAGRASMVGRVKAGVARVSADKVAPAVAHSASGALKLLKRRSPKQLFLWSALVLLVLAGGVFGFVRGKGPTYLPKQGHPFSRTEHSAEAEKAAELLSQGHPKKAMLYLKDNAAKIKAEPYAQLILGHASASAQQNVGALQAYQRAVILENDLARNKLLRTNLDLLLEKDKAEVTDAALGLMATLVRQANDKKAAKKLVEIASSAPLQRNRKRAMSLVEELDRGDEIDRLQSYTLDLEQGKRCSDRRDAVAKLRALGDKRAIPALSAAMSRKQKRGIFGRRVNVNACLRKHAEEAIQYLESL